MKRSLTRFAAPLFCGCLHLLKGAGVLLATLLGIPGLIYTLYSPIALLISSAQPDNPFPFGFAAAFLYGILAVTALLILSCSCFRALETLTRKPLSAADLNEAGCLFCLAGAALLPPMLLTLALEPLAAWLVPAALVMLVFDLIFWTSGLSLRLIQLRHCPSDDVSTLQVPRWIKRPTCLLARWLSTRLRVRMLLAVCCLIALPLGWWLFQPLGHSDPFAWLLTALWSALWSLLLAVDICPSRRLLTAFSFVSASMSLLLADRLMMRNIVVWLVDAFASDLVTPLLSPLLIVGVSIFLLAPAALFMAAACAAWLPRPTFSEVKA